MSQKRSDRRFPRSRNSNLILVLFITFDLQVNGFTLVTVILSDDESPVLRFKEIRLFRRSHLDRLFLDLSAQSSMRKSKIHLLQNFFEVL